MKFSEVKIGQVVRATEEEDEYDGALVRIIKPSETSDEYYVEILTGPKKGEEQGPWSPECMIELSPLEQLALGAEDELLQAVAEDHRVRSPGENRST